MRNFARVFIACALVGLLAAAGLALDIFLSFPTLQDHPIEAPDLTGVVSDSNVWVVPVEGGVVWVDAGSDPSAELPLKATAGRKVLAVLITHGHADHVLGLAALEGVPIYAGPGEGPFIQGRTGPGTLLGSFFAAIMGDAGDQPTLQEIHDGDTLTLGGQSFTGIHVPGHTPGSVIWLWKDVAFTGDSLLGHSDQLLPVHRIFATDYEQNLLSVKKIAGRGIQRIADGHAGLHTQAAALVEGL